MNLLRSVPTKLMAQIETTWDWHRLPVNGLGSGTSTRTCPHFPLPAYPPTVPPIKCSSPAPKCLPPTSSPPFPSPPDPALTYLSPVPVAMWGGRHTSTLWPISPWVVWKFFCDTFQHALVKRALWIVPLFIFRFAYGCFPGLLISS